MNLKQELQKFSNLKIFLAGSDYRSPWSAFGSKCNREPEDMCRDVVLVSNSQVFSANCLAHPEVSGMEKLRKWEKRESEQEFQCLKNMGFTLEGCKENLFGTDFDRRRQFYVPFARVVMDEAHNIRNKTSKTFSWLKYLGIPIWLVSGSAGSMSPAQWDGWRGLLEQKEWKTHPTAKSHTNDRFARLQNRFTAAAKAPRIQQDAIDSDEGPLQNQRYECRQVLEEWGDLLRAMMIRRCATDKLWGQALMPLPEGIVQAIDFPLQSYSQQMWEAYSAFERQERAEFSKCSTKLGAGGELVKPKFDYSNRAKKGYLRCRVASTLPAVCLLPEFVQMSFLKGWIEEISKEDREGQKPASIMKSKLDFIINNSPKLRWLRKFIGKLGHDHLGRPEKLLIFSSSAMILYCVDLVSLRPSNVEMPEPVNRQ